MESTITPLDDIPGLCVTFRGGVTGADLVAVLDELTHRLGAGDVPDPLNVLWDARAIVSLAIVPEDLASLAAAMGRLAPYIGRGRSAVLHSGGQVNPELMGRLLVAQAPKGSRTRAMFTDHEAAVAWMAGE